MHSQDGIFQQDKAAIHTAKLTSNWHGDHNIETLSYPAKSPDLNPIENFWDILSRKVYADVKQYKDKETLWTARQDCCAIISQ